jgi:hypothetical protein
MVACENAGTTKTGEGLIPSYTFIVSPFLSRAPLRVTEPLTPLINKSKTASPWPVKTLQPPVTLKKRGLFIYFGTLNSNSKALDIPRPFYRDFSSK